MSNSTTGGRDRRLKPLDEALLGADQFGTWWVSATWPSRGIALGAMAVVVGLAFTVLWGVLQVLDWLGAHLVHLAESGSKHVSAWPITHVIGDPVRQTLADAGLPANTATLTALWAAASLICWLGSVIGLRGARIGWAVVGVATGALVFTGTDEPSRLVATAVAAVAWALLSIPAYWRPRTDPKVLIVRPEVREPQED